MHDFDERQNLLHLGFQGQNKVIEGLQKQLETLKNDRARDKSQVLDEGFKNEVKTTMHKILELAETTKADQTQLEDDVARSFEKVKVEL